MFRKFLESRHLLFNEAGTEEAGGGQTSYQDDIASILAEEGASTEDSGEISGIEASSNESESVEVSANESSEKSEKESNEKDDLISKFLDGEAPEEGQAESTEESEEGDESEEGSSELLEKINSLKLVHDGKTFDVQSPEHAKELIQKGYDYTQKTQAFSEEKKAWESERASMETQLRESEAELSENYKKFQSQLTENQVMEQVLTQLRQEDPDIVEEIAHRFRSTQNQLDNPVFRSKLDEMNNTINELKSGRESEKATVAQKEFDLEYQGTKDLVDQLKDTLGLDVSRELIMERWIKGDDVKKAIFAEYGDKILKLQESKNKVAKTKRAVGNKVATGGSRSRVAAKTSQKVDYSKSYQDIMQDIGSLLR